MNSTPKLKFLKLAVNASFEIFANPAESIYDECVRQFPMEIFATDGTEDADGELIEISVGHLTIAHLRFDVALNLGIAPLIVADSISSDVLDAYELAVQNPRLDEGMEGDSLLIHRFDLQDRCRGTALELDALRCALIGLSSGCSKALMRCGVVAIPIPISNPNPNHSESSANNEVALRYASLGFKPLKVGSEMLWLNLELQSFWE